MPEKIYTTDEAAAYLGIVPGVLRYHVYTSHHIKPDVTVGGNYGFYRDTLDAYLRQYQSTDMTLAEAAAYLGVSLNRMRHHVYHLGHLQPTGKRGRNRTYSVAALDAARPIITAPVTSGRPALEHAKK